ncbi:hypothetical protein JR065_14080 [Xanthomonas sp. AmX2]|uniref:hypothetical protein n=1 Tax=Xanthomonas sp. TaxID=29446 RepID=UPI00197E2FA5|nr:hypothetical protein [Xanthomonas sp.]MBN6151470.1 hypothetical protein [Xanthomonas sp.]
MRLANWLTGSLVLAAILPAAAAMAQQAQNCPPLPPQAKLQWNERSDKGFIVCRAMAADGRQVLGMMLTARDPNIPLARNLREEKGSIAGESMHWYRPDLGGVDAPGLASRRVTVVELGEDHYAQVWIDAGDVQELQSLQSLVQGLDMSPTRLALDR